MPQTSCCDAAAELNGAYKIIHDLFAEIGGLEIRLALVENDNRYVKEVTRLNEADNAILKDLKDELRHFIALYQPVAADAATSLWAQLDALREIHATGTANTSNNNTTRRPPDIVTERECWKCKESERRMAFADEVGRLNIHAAEEENTGVAHWIIERRGRR